LFSVPPEEAVTVIVFVADFPPAEAVITVEPAVTPFTIPAAASTEAQPESLLDHVTVLSVALSGLTVAVSVIELPAVTESSPLMEMPVTATVDPDESPPYVNDAQSEQVESLRVP
jgi:hypothetical protein